MSSIYDVFSSELMHSRIENISKCDKEFFLSLPPYRIEIQPTTFCNRRCSFCSHSGRNQTGNELTQGQVLQIIDSATKIGTKHISFSGGGEPLEWKIGDMESVIKTAPHFLDFTLTTNGDGFWDDLQLNFTHLYLLESCSSIIINVPGVDEITYEEQIRGNASWKKTKSILAKMIEIKKTNNLNCILCCVVVVSKMNIKKLATIDKALVELGVDKIYYKTMKDYENHRLNALSITQEDISELQTSLSYQPSCWLIQFLRSLETVQIVQPTKCWSNIIGLSAIIDPNGNVFSCTPTVGNPQYSLGNINCANFVELWKSDIRWNIIQQLHDNCANGRCPKDCRLISHNLLIEHFLHEDSSFESFTMNAGMDDKMS